ncbi:MAG: hypothetical protein ACKOCH_12790, partial [Bacteroidota bacterium]
LLMLQNWLKTIPASLVKLAGQHPQNQLGPNMLLFHGQLPDLKKVRVAIIGAGEKEANAVREQGGCGERGRREIQFQRL